VESDIHHFKEEYSTPSLNLSKAYFDAKIVCNLTNS